MSSTNPFTDVDPESPTAAYYPGDQALAALLSGHKTSSTENRSNPSSVIPTTTNTQMQSVEPIGFVREQPAHTISSNPPNADPLGCTVNLP